MLPDHLKQEHILEVLLQHKTTNMLYHKKQSVQVDEKPGKRLHEFLVKV